MSKESSPKQPFLAFASTAADIAVLKEFATGKGWSADAILKGDIRTATDYLKTNASPLLLLVELPSVEEAPTLLDALADVVDPDTKVITVGTINEYSFYCWLMDLGIFSYLLKPLTEPMLEGAYHKSVTPVSAAGQTEKQPGKIISVLGARGGVGASTIALNLAGIIAKVGHMQVALMDVDPHYGTIALSLDIEPSRGLRDALEKPDRIDSLFLERVMTRINAQLYVIGSEEPLSEQIMIHERASEMLLRELKTRFDVIILDVPAPTHDFARQCLKQSEQVVLVTDLSILSLRDVLRTSDLMRDTLKMKPPLVIANKVGAVAKHETQIADFEKALGAKFAERIAYAPDIYIPIGDQMPALRHPDHAAVRPLYELAGKLVPLAKTKAKAAPKKSFSLMNIVKKKP